MVVFPLPEMRDLMWPLVNMSCLLIRMIGLNQNCAKTLWMG